MDRQFFFFQPAVTTKYSNPMHGGWSPPLLDRTITISPKELKLTVRKIWTDEIKWKRQNRRKGKTQEEICLINTEGKQEAPAGQEHHYQPRKPASRRNTIRSKFIYICVGVCVWGSAGGGGWSEGGREEVMIRGGGRQSWHGKRCSAHAM